MHATWNGETMKPNAHNMEWRTWNGETMKPRGTQQKPHNRAKKNLLSNLVQARPHVQTTDADNHTAMPWTPSVQIGASKDTRANFERLAWRPNWRKQNHARKTRDTTRPRCARHSNCHAHKTPKPHGQTAKTSRPHDDPSRPNGGNLAATRRPSRPNDDPRGIFKKTARRKRANLTLRIETPIPM